LIIDSDKTKKRNEKSTRNGVVSFVSWYFCIAFKRKRPIVRERESKEKESKRGKSNKSGVISEE